MRQPTWPKSNDVRSLQSEQVKHATQAGNGQWHKQQRKLWCYAWGRWWSSENDVNDEIELPEKFVESKSVTNFKDFEALHIIVLDMDDQLLCSDVQMEVGKMFDEYHELWLSFEMFQRNINKLTLKCQVWKIHVFAANEFAWRVQTIKYEP